MLPKEKQKAWNKGTKGICKPNKTSFKKGQKAWNKGKKMSNESRKKLSISLLGNVNHKGKKHSEKTKKKLSIIFKGRQPWNTMPVGSKRIMSDGYVGIKIGEPKEWKREHIYIMEQKLNRKIDWKIEIVHHVDGNKQNNKLSNLKLMPIGEHHRLHTLEMWKRRKGLI